MYAIRSYYDIGIEGAIGVGKTSLAKILAQKFSARLIQEEVTNNP